LSGKLFGQSRVMPYGDGRNKEKHAPNYNRPLNPKVAVMNIVNAYVSA